MLFPLYSNVISSTRSSLTTLTKVITSPPTHCRHPFSSFKYSPPTDILHIFTYLCTICLPLPKCKRHKGKYSKVKGAGMRGQEKEMDIHPSVLQGSWAKMMDLQWGIRTWSCTLNWIIFLKLKVTRKLWDLPKIPWKNMNGRFDSMEERSDWRNIKSPHVYTPSALRLPPQKHIRTYEKFRRLGWRHNFKLSKIQSNADKRP